ncbi:MAG: NAD(P)H-dependent oxidoreductase [Chitinophagaceae bacterium]
MNALIFNGIGLEGKAGGATAGRLVSHLEKTFAQIPDCNVETFHLAEAGIPMLHTDFNKVSGNIKNMAAQFKKADIHIWIAPMYHGSMPGAMKNCLDWLEITARDEQPYLTDKIVGLVCWADGGQAMLGVNSMDNVAKSLRAWVLPYSIPIVRKDLFDGEAITELYRHKLEKMVHLLSKAKNK